MANHLSRRSIAAALLLIPIMVFGKPKRREFNNSAAEVYAAAVGVAKEHKMLLSTDDPNLKFTFDTGRSSVTMGFIGHASVESLPGGRAALVIDLERKNKDEGLDLGTGAHMTDRFFAWVAANLPTPTPVPSTPPAASSPAAPAAVESAAPAHPATPPHPPAPAADYGTLTVTCAAENADVTIDGAFFGNIPATVRLAPGKHTVEVGLAGHKTWSREITITTGANLHLIASIEKQ